MFNPILILIDIPFALIGTFGFGRQREALSIGMKYYDDENSKLSGYSNDMSLLNHHCLTECSFRPKGNKNNSSEALAEYIYAAKQIRSCLNRSEGMKYICDIVYSFCEVTAELSPETVNNDIYDDMTVLLLYCDEGRKAGFNMANAISDSVSSRYKAFKDGRPDGSIIITCLTDKAARETVSLLEEAGIDARIQRRSIPLLEKG